MVFERQPPLPKKKKKRGGGGGGGGGGGEGTEKKKTPPPPKKKKKKTGLGVRWRWREGGYRKKKIKAKSAECVLSEAAAQLN